MEAQISHFEKDNNYSASYHETIAFYQELAEKSDIVQIQEYGKTDAGYPLHEVIVDANKDFDTAKSRERGKAILLINNAIHPGEPCGVDASMMLVRDLIDGKLNREWLQNQTIVIIPFYNIGGGLNRGSSSRANQLGPKLYGFRGNARNLDLNRDFIKTDSQNAQTFNQLFNKWNPDIMIDNHTSNGADYQYTMTLIATQKDKLEASLSTYMTSKMLPALYKGMEEAGWEMTPYVYSRGIPDNGIYGFLDMPRYSSGYAALHHTISFMPETHMLKPFKDRVWSTYAFSVEMLKHISTNKEEILKARKESISSYKVRKKAAINWALDAEKEEKIKFKGYEAKYKKSEVTGSERLYYDRDAPFTKEIPFFNNYNASKEIEIPEMYIVPRSYPDVIRRLQWNGVEMEKVEDKMEKEVAVYYIDKFETTPVAYEGHFLHSNIEVSCEIKKITLLPGDMVIKTNQERARYIVETLEPEAPDSFFAWNFFDGILMQKEYFSPYVFEDKAAEMLKANKGLKAEFENKKDSDENFANDPRAQLRFIYERSDNYEQTHKMYPVYRVMN